MSRAWDWAVAVAGALTLAACGGGSSGGGDPEPVEDQATVDQGKTTAQDTSQLTTIAIGADTAAAQGPIHSVGTKIQGLASRYQGLKAQQQAAAAQGLTAAVEQAQMEGDSVTYTENHLSANIHYAEGATQLHYVVELDILPQDGGGHIFDGTFDIQYAAQSQGFDIDYDFSAEYAELKLDPANCAVSGSLSVSYDISVSGGPAGLPAGAGLGDSIGGSGTLSLTFGPTCGEVVAEGD